MPRTKTVYNVWVQIEAQDVGTGDGQDVGLPDKIFESDFYSEAARFVRALPGWAEQAETSDYRAKDTGMEALERLVTQRGGRAEQKALRAVRDVLEAARAGNTEPDELSNMAAEVLPGEPEPVKSPEPGSACSCGCGAGLENPELCECGAPRGHK